MTPIPFRHPLAVRRMSLLQIDELVSARLGETRGRGRSQPMVFNRQTAMYLASRVGRWSTTVIGRFYQRRDHSTVCYSIQKIEKLRKENPEINELLSDLERELHEQHSRAQTQQNNLSSFGWAISESQIELVARSVAEQVFLIVKDTLQRSVSDPGLRNGNGIEAAKPLRPLDMNQSRQIQSPHPFSEQ